MLASVSAEDFLVSAPSVFAATPSYYAYGSVNGIMPEERFREITRPLAQVARQYTPVNAV